MVREDFFEETTLDLRHKEKGRILSRQRKQHMSRSRSKVGKGPASTKNRKEARVAETEGAPQHEVGKAGKASTTLC